MSNHHCRRCQKPLRRCLIHRGSLCWACCREQRAAAVFGAALAPCRHCGQRPPSRSRGLCWRCYADFTIRTLYPAYVKGHSAPKLDKLPLLPMLTVYPDHARRVRCPHGRRDGECPECEKKQRREAGIVATAEEEEES